MPKDFLSMIWNAKHVLDLVLIDCFHLVMSYLILSFRIFICTRTNLSTITRYWLSFTFTLNRIHFFTVSNCLYTRVCEKNVWIKISSWFCWSFDRGNIARKITFEDAKVKSSWFYCNCRLLFYVFRVNGEEETLTKIRKEETSAFTCIYSWTMGYHIQLLFIHLYFIYRYLSQEWAWSATCSIWNWSICLEHIPVQWSFCLPISFLPSCLRFQLTPVRLSNPIRSFHPNRGTSSNHPIEQLFLFWIMNLC